MSLDVVHGALYVLATYGAIGVLVGVPFVIAGIGRVDPGAKGSPATFRALVLPGVVALWPLMLRRWVQSRGRS